MANMSMLGELFALDRRFQINDSRGYRFKVIATGCLGKGEKVHGRMWQYSLKHRNTERSFPHNQCFSVSSQLWNVLHFMRHNKAAVVWNLQNSVGPHRVLVRWMSIEIMCTAAALPSGHNVILITVLLLQGLPPQPHHSSSLTLTNVWL